MSEDTTPTHPAPRFIHLHTHSAYSLAEGAVHVKDLVKLCGKKHMPALAITDTNNMFGAMEFALEATSAGVQPILGVQIDVAQSAGQLVLLAQSETGYRNMCRLINKAYMADEAGKEVAFGLDDICACADGIICLTGGSGGIIAKSILHGQSEQAERMLDSLQSAFGDRLYIELQRHGWPHEAQVEPALLDLAYARNIPIVATNDCYFATKDMYEAHDALLCIAQGRYISEVDRRKVTPHHYFKSEDEMVALFADLPEAIENTVQIAKRCHYLLKVVDPILPPFATEGGRTEIEELKVQAAEGLRWRLDNYVLTPEMDAAQRDKTEKDYQDRLDFELNTIIQMGFPGYFLIVSDFIRWAKEQDVPVGPGRGSGAGSLAAWSLQITDLDPIKLGLLFERFLNPDRVSMPDFDVDFCQDRRDEVITYVQKRYGVDRVAQIITFGKLQARAVLRDVGRVLQMSYGAVDRIAKMIPNNPAHPVTLAEALEGDMELRTLRDSDATYGRLIGVALQLEGLYRHASTHAAGVVIADRPLADLIPVYRDPRSPMPVTQFNMKFVEKAGLVKYDFLGLKTLTVIKTALDLIRKQTGEEHDMLKIPFDDQKTFDLLSSGAGVGVFQLESGGMRDTLKKLRPTRFEDIIALVALYRPGPMDNIPKYIAVKEGREEPDYLHPVLKPVSEETFGIMIYQEQVMKAARVLAGYTLANADLLRRAMGKKIKAEMDAQRERFIEGAATHNQVPADQASAIFNQMEKFADYGFNKSHAAAYALIAYQTAWLKANYSVAFMAATMTLDKGNTDKLAVFKQELDSMDIKILTPDINASEVDFTVEGDAIRYALSALKGVGSAAMQSIVDERQANGPFACLADFLGRIDTKAMNKRMWEALVTSGAFDSLHPNRAQLHASGEVVMGHIGRLAAERDSGQENLFGGGPESGPPTLPPLVPSADWDNFTKLGYEFEAVGFYLSAHPLDSKQALLQRLNVTLRAELEDKMQTSPSSRFTMAAVILKKQEKISAKGNKFGILQLSDATGAFEVMLFSDLLTRCREMLEEGSSILLSVDAEMRDDQLRMLAQDIKPMDDVAQRSLRDITIAITDAGAVPGLQKVLVPLTGQGPVGVQVAVRTDTHSVTIKLPGSWAISPSVCQALRQVAGVTDLHEH
ncbi:MAG: DNA polymerase III subunit alpha [Pseudomonadota bacterium]